MLHGFRAVTKMETLFDIPPLTPFHVVGGATPSTPGRGGVRCSEKWTGCSRDHAAEARALSPLARWAISIPDACPCTDCEDFLGPHGVRLERWRFGALKRLLKARRIPRGRDRFKYNPMEAASMLAEYLGHQPPACRGSAWRYLCDQYDEKLTPPHKSTLKADRRRQGS